MDCPADEPGPDAPFAMTGRTGQRRARVRPLRGEPVRLAPHVPRAVAVQGGRAGRRTTAVRRRWLAMALAVAASLVMALALVNTMNACRQYFGAAVTLGMRGPS